LTLILKLNQDGNNALSLFMAGILGLLWLYTDIGKHKDNSDLEKAVWNADRCYLVSGHKLVLRSNSRQQSLSMQMENLTGGAGISPERTRIVTAAASS
jgi:hypothetical protein